MEVGAREVMRGRGVGWVRLCMAPCLEVCWETHAGWAQG